MNLGMKYINICFKQNKKCMDSRYLSKRMVRTYCIAQNVEVQSFQTETGYNGNAYNGSQKQNQILTTVENEIETALYKCGMIRESNYRSLSKISFSRATRTDKGVHALLNCFSAKLLIDLDKPLTELYDYIVPTFLFNPNLDLKFTVKKSEDNPDDQVEDMKVLNKITIDPQCLSSVYSYRLEDNSKELLSNLFHQFEGTHSFHNYSRRLSLDNPEACRYILSTKVNETSICNGIEFIRLSIKGQSFLFNQIRKMIGALFMIMHFNVRNDFIPYSLACDFIKVPIVPADGLILDHVSYSIYNNKRKFYIPELVEPWNHKLPEINQFRSKLFEHICKSELENNVYTKWIALLHHFRTTFTVQEGLTPSTSSESRVN